MRKWIDLVESLTPNRRLVDLAQRYDDVDAFIEKTDGEYVLYRGHFDDTVGDNSFMTDWYGHALVYANNEKDKVDAFQFSFGDVLRFNDETFDDLRSHCRRMSGPKFGEIYREALSKSRYDGDPGRALRTVRKVIQSDTPYSKISGNPEVNDPLIPLMQRYAREVHGRNIISFLGNDYADYGGQDEFVVGDISKLLNLRDLHRTIHTQELTEDVATNVVSIDALPLQSKLDIMDMLLVNNPKFENFWEKEWGAASFTDAYVGQFIFGTEDLEDSASKGFQNQYFEVRLLNLPLRDIVSDKPTSPSTVSRYSGIDTPPPPILVRREGNKWRVVEGGHRYAAALARGRETIPAIDVTAFFTVDWDEYARLSS